MPELPLQEAGQAEDAAGDQGQEEVPQETACRAVEYEPLVHALCLAGAHHGGGRKAEHDEEDCQPDECRQEAEVGGEDAMVTVNHRGGKGCRDAGIDADEDGGGAAEHQEPGGFFHHLPDIFQGVECFFVIHS